MSRKVTVTLKLDFELLRKQKELLISMVNRRKKPSDAKYHLDGLVTLLDSIQDQAVDKCRVPAKEVFGPDYPEDS